MEMSVAVKKVWTRLLAFAGIRFGQARNARTCKSKCLSTQNHKIEAIDSSNDVVFSIIRLKHLNPESEQTTQSVTAPACGDAETRDKNVHQTNSHTIDKLLHFSNDIHKEDSQRRFHSTSEKTTQRNSVQRVAINRQTLSVFKNQKVRSRQIRLQKGRFEESDTCQRQPQPARPRPTGV